MDNQQPSYDPANTGTMAGVFREVLRKFLMGTDDMLPAKVIAYDRTKNIAQVQPQIMVLTTDKQTVSRAQIAEVPVFSFGGGGFVINFPIKTDDTGWIKANDRDISLYMRALSESGPNTLRLHSFADGLFIPDAIRGFVITEEDAEAMVIQSTSGDVRIALHGDNVKITAPDIVFDTPTAHFLHDVHVGGTVTADVNIIFGGKDGLLHEHINGGGVGNSGPVA